MHQVRRLLATVSTVAAVLLAGCANSPFVQSVDAKAAALAANLNQLTDQDLATAISNAQNFTPPDMEAVTCFTYVRTLLPVLKSQAAILTTHGGVVTTFESLHLLVGVAENGPSQKADFEKNCGPYVLNVVGGLNFLLEQVRVTPIPLPKI